VVKATARLKVLAAHAREHLAAAAAAAAAEAENGVTSDVEGGPGGRQTLRAQVAASISTTWPAAKVVLSGMQFLVDDLAGFFLLQQGGSTPGRSS
jgi:hypothetical protein